MLMSNEDREKLRVKYLKLKELTAKNGYDEYFAKQTESWTDIDIIKMHEALIEKFISKTGFYFKGKEVIDYGCKYGHTLLLLKWLGAKTAIGIDIEDSYVNEANRWISEMKIKDIKVFKNHGYGVPLRSGRFDFCFINEVVSHINPIVMPMFFLELNRLLKVDGYFLISDGNNLESLKKKEMLKILYDQYENGPVGIKAINGDIINRPYRTIREELIREWYPELDEKTIKYLAVNTSFLYGDMLHKVVDDYLKYGRTTEKTYIAGLPPIHPVSGVTIERGLYPEHLTEEIQQYHFDTIVESQGDGFIIIGQKKDISKVVAHTKKDVKTLGLISGCCFKDWDYKYVLKSGLNLKTTNANILTRGDFIGLYNNLFDDIVYLDFLNQGLMYWHGIKVLDIANSSVRKCYTMLKEHNVKVLRVDDITAARYGAILSYLLNIPTCVRASSSFCYDFYIRDVDCILSLSKGAEEIFKRVVPADKIRYIGQPLDLKLVKRVSAEEVATRYPAKNKIIIQGRISFEKNYINMFEALVGFFKKYPDSYVIVIGCPVDNFLYNYLLQIINSNDLQDKFTFIDKVPICELIKYYSWADCLLHVSRIEGMSNTILESLACETPVITTNYGSMSELVQDGYNGLLVDDCEDAREIYDKLCAFFSNEDLRNKLRQNTRQSVLKYDAKGCLKREEEIYREILNKNIEINSIEVVEKRIKDINSAYSLNTKVKELFAYYELSQYRVEDYIDYLEHHDYNVYDLINALNFFYAHNRFDEYIRHFKILENKIKYVAIECRDLGRVYIEINKKLNKLGEISEFINKYFSGDLTFGMDYRFAGLIYFSMGEFNKAAKALKKFITICDENGWRDNRLASGYFYMARCYEATSDLNEAVIYYKKCLDITPENREANRRLNVLKNISNKRF